MKVINTQEAVQIPEGVEVSVDNRVVSVKGPRGELSKSFKHLALDIYLETIKGSPSVVVESWNQKKKKNAIVRTVSSHIRNLITGVTKGFRYFMKFVYAHFPINASIIEEGSAIEIRNFLGERKVRRVNMLPGVTVEQTTNKDEIQIDGNDIESVSQSAASIHMSTLVKNKDIRKFLDGVYVSKKAFVAEEE